MTQDTSEALEVAKILEQLSERDCRFVQFLVSGRGPTVALVRPPGEAPRAFDLDPSGGLRSVTPATDRKLAPPDWDRLGCDADAAQRAQLIAYRPGRRAVYKVGGDAGSKLQFVKLFARRAFDSTTATLAALALRPVESLVWPSTIDQESRALVLPNAGSSSLYALSADAPFPMEALAGLLHGWRGHGTELSGSVDLETYRADALRMVARAARVTPCLRELYEAVERTRCEASMAVDLVHGDLHDKQIFVDGSSLRVIDYENARRGDGRIDVFNLAEHLRLRSLQRGDSCSEEQRSALLDAAETRSDDSFAQKATGVIRARLAAVYALRPVWSELSERLGAEAMECLR